MTPGLLIPTILKRSQRLPDTRITMEHVRRNIEARRAQIGITMTQIEEATGYPRQQLHRITTRPDATSVRSIGKVAMVLFCPVAALLSNDPADAVRYPLPPTNFLQILRDNRERFGFDRGGKLIDWDHFTTTINNS
jgi:hypothetical protein